MRNPALFSMPIALSLALGGCSMPTVASGGGGSVLIGAGEDPEVHQDVVTVVWAATDVFERAAIPVAEADEIIGEVRSGTFRVWREWGGEDVRARIVCPTGLRVDVGELYMRPFEVSVVARARDRGAGRTRVSVAGRAVSHADLPRPERIACTLREEFRAWLADEIRRRAMNEPPRARRIPR